MESQSLNPYRDAPVATVPQRSSVDVQSSRAITEVQSMILMAKRFPRDPIRAMDAILNECRNQKLAELALYTYSRGGTDITGPSIRLAEVIQRHWGNMESGIIELSQSNGQSELLAFAWDLESNSRDSKVFTVKHERHTKKGSYVLNDSRDVYEINANFASRRKRACILSIVPGHVVEAAVQQCEETLHAKADTSGAATKKMVEAFAQYGVTKAQIEVRIQRKLDAITPAQVIALRKIYNSLKDGMSSPADWFEVAAEEAKPGRGTDALKKKLKKEAKQEPDFLEPVPGTVKCEYDGEEKTFEDCQPCVGKCTEYNEATKI